ncbi:MAG: UDP-N-acetylmuramoyl-L-alanyl-D-glutamate--2,6-diaminopimelate ligase [bacterium]|nr:UDP-N-acetylmuramoyl-L-alanyl-D-glutamate--2,6-diaminopimelate ligase [bacterium]
MLKRIIKKIIPPALLRFYHFLLAFFAAVLYQFPSQKIKVIGVTGTNGKTTVINLTAKILEEAGIKVASLSSINFKIGAKEWKNDLKMTMPGRFLIQKFLRTAVDEKCQYAILEVTSEGISQHRHRFINFDAAVFTNLSPEHIEAHKGFENYRAAKGRLFQAAKNIHIINIDDGNAEYFLQFPAKDKIGYTIFSPNQSYRYPISIIEALNCQETADGISFSVRDIIFNLKLLGEFNIYNTLAAICVGLSQGISLEICKKALEKIEGIPGRMEKVISDPFKVFVDYAFTPNALEQVYQTLNPAKRDESKNIHSSSSFAILGQTKKRTQFSSPNVDQKLPSTKLICVLGACGGGRDKWKRPVLGKIAAKYCSEIIVTNEDPYDEDPMDIINQVASGASGKAKKILDRREAIQESLKSAKPGDVVVVTGKGCEPWICLKGGKKIPWDDRQIVREEFQKLKID